jgi:hypothetical protein
VGGGKKRERGELGREKGRLLKRGNWERVNIEKGDMGKREKNLEEEG